MLRVAAIIASEIVSGPGRQLTAIAVALQQRGVELRPIVLQRSREWPPLALHMEKSGVECAVVRDNGPIDPALVRRLRRMLEEWQPQLLQTHSYKATAAGFLLSRARAGLPWIAFFHGSTDAGIKDRVYHRVERYLFRRADTVVGMSERHRVELATSAARVRIIPNAVLPLSVDSTRKLDGSTSDAAGPRVIAAIGRLSHEKGIDVLLRALALLSRYRAGWHCVIAGDGPERNRLESLASRLGIAESVRFLGHVADLSALYASADLVVLPSRSEGLPNVLLEALFAGKPVIATEVGAVPEVMAQAGAAYVVPPADAPTLAERIGSWLAGELPDIAELRYGVLARYSLERRVDDHLALYEEVLASIRTPDAIP